MQYPQFKAPSYNQHYEGSYSNRMLEWRNLGAEDKANNIVSLLRSNGFDNVNSILEVGCGTGAVLLAVKKRGLGSLHMGVDLANPNEHPDPGVAESDISLHTYDGIHLPFEDDSFDLVYASHVLEHVPDERGFLAEIKRVSRRIVYIEVPCELHFRTSVKSLQATLNIGHINAYTPEAFELTLVTSELAPIDVKLFDHSEAVHAFNSSPFKAKAKMMLRRGLLCVNQSLASRLFTFHCGALIDLSKRSS